MVAEGADLLIVESDSVKGPVLDLPLVAIGSCRGDPTNVDVAAATEKGIPVLRAPGRNADAVAEMAVGLLFAVTRGIPRADLDVRAGETYRDGTIPYQRFRAWQVAGQTVGIVGYGAVGRAAAWRFAGLGMNVHQLRPVRARRHPLARRPARRSRRRVDARGGHARVARDDRRRAVRAHAAKVRSTSTPPGPVCTTPTRSPRRWPTATSAAPGSTTSTASASAVDHPLCSMSNVVLTPHIGGATYDTETNHTSLIVDGLVTPARRRQPAQPGEPGGPEVSPSDAPRRPRPR